MLALNIEAQLERLQSDQKLQKAWRDLNFKSAALDQHCIVSISDNEGKLTYVNDKLCEISGWSRDELLNQPHRTLMSMHHSEEYIQHAWKSFRLGKSGAASSITRPRRAKITGSTPAISHR
ncbi:PAS domain S-box protein [Hankyongella ginsenosidimutans]|uniref:PAS domain S-box protein n=1 Tax=Hankyongella ginsenosidimutans TaxID=1763828 RepID=A0A4D7C8L4_9SPHN|nr:PAS domain S-box protein [Hankyongella ginsenosidimutans]